MQATIGADWLWALCRAPLPDWEWELDLAWHLFQAEQTGDDAMNQSLRQQLTIGNLPLAAVLARRYARSTDDWGELFSAGALGLVEATSRYDPARPALFRSFARRWVRGAILISLRRLFAAGVSLSLDRPLSPDSDRTCMVSRLRNLAVFVHRSRVGCETVKSFRFPSMWRGGTRKAMV